MSRPTVCLSKAKQDRLQILCPGRLLREMPDDLDAREDTDPGFCVADQPEEQVGNLSACRGKFLLKQLGQISQEPDQALLAFLREA